MTYAPLTRRAVLAQHGIALEKSAQPKRWQVGHEQLDKGAVIAKARALVAPAPPAPARPAYRALW